VRKYFAIILIFSLCCSALPCSSAIISAKASSDGRPLLWKHRDARQDENELRWFHGDKFDFIGLVETQDTTGTQVWIGANSAGFAIINTNSYNLNKENYKGSMDQDGYLMKEALGRCATLKDFEQYLTETTGKRGVIANSGFSGKKDEDPLLTTIWTIPGFPLTPLTVPAWVAAGKELPQTVRGAGILPPYRSIDKGFLRE
jgi:hypothetical protein